MKEATVARVLSLDDSAEMLDLLSLILERKGYDHITTTNSYEAWALLHTIQVDLFTQDVSRPDINGWEFYHLLRSNTRLRHIPVLMVTTVAQLYPRETWGLPREMPSQNFGADQAATLDVAAYGYVTKPFGPHELLKAVKELLLFQDKPTPESAWSSWSDVHKRSPKELSDALHDDRAWIRRAALLEWGRKKRSIESPIQALEDPDSAVRRAAVQVLRRYKDPRALEFLSNMLKDPVLDVRLEAAQALGLLDGQQAMKSLIEMLESADKARWAAAWALGRLKATQATSPLIAALRDENNLVRMMAALALGSIGDPRATQPLTVTLLDDDAWVCRAVAFALGQIGDPQAIEHLARTLHHPVAWICNKTAYTLTKIGGSAVESLVKKLHNFEVRVRRAVASSLWHAKNERVVKHLVAALEDADRDVRLMATRSLGQIGDRQAVEPLIAALWDDDPDIAWTAAYALGRLGDNRALLSLKQVAQGDTRQTEHGQSVAEAARQSAEMIQR